MVTRTICLLLTFFFLENDSFCQYKNISRIILDKNCSFDNQNRKIIDTLKYKIAYVTRQFDNIILVIDNKKYLACNIPLTIKQKQIRVSGYILQTFATEKVIATPLKIIKATTL